MESKSWLEKFLVPLFILFLLIVGLNLTKDVPVSAAPTLKVHFLNVGQGDSTLIKTPNQKYVLVDGGPDKKVITELGKQIPVGKREIEAVVLTHPHADHVAGLNYVLERYQIKKIYLTGVVHTSPDYLEFLEKVKIQKITAEKVTAGKLIEIDGVKLKFHWPGDLSQFSGKDLNSTSAVFELTFGSQSFLFLGDLPAKEQENIVKLLGKSAVIKISHHGSKYGILEEILTVVNPLYAVISVGKNDYGHPAPSVISALSSQKILRTDEKGTITFETDGNVLKLLE